MDPLITGLLAIVAMLVAIALGVPVGLGMAAVGFVGMALFAGLPFALGTLTTLPYSMSAQYVFVVVPMFLLMGSLASVSGITSELYTSAHRVFSGVRGGLYYATVVASAMFSAVTGSTVVASAVFTRIALPEMIRFGYRSSVAAGCIAASGTFAALIPPSISMVVYGILTGESIGALLMAGLVPGLVTVLAYIVGIRVMLALRPDWAPAETKPYGLREIVQSFRGLWGMVLLIIVVLGGIYSGIVAPSAAGTIGAAGALLICLMRRRLSARNFWDSLAQSVSTTSVLFLIIIGGEIFSRFLLSVGFVDGMLELVEGAGITPAMFIILTVVMLLILGIFLDTLSMMIMTIPFLYPILISMGMSGIWFGVIFVKLCEIAAISPPVGLNLSAVVGSSNKAVTSSEVFRGVAPFLVIETLVLIVLLVLPELSLWLPNMMMQ